jgi:hypothetical protein
VRDHPPDGETQNSRNGDGHAGALRIFEIALNENDTNKKFQLIKTKLQRRFGLLPATAAVISELAFVAGYSR